MDERIKIIYEISDSKIFFLDLLLFKDPANNKLQYSTFQKPLNKYLYIPYESFHSASNKEAFIKGELMRYARNSSTFRSFSETRQLFWKRLRLRGYPARFLLPVFREINYSNRSKWLSKPKQLSRQRTVVSKSTYNCSHVGIKKVILKHLPNLSSIVSYKSTNTQGPRSEILTGGLKREPAFFRGGGGGGGSIPLEIWILVTLSYRKVVLNCFYNLKQH